MLTPGIGSKKLACSKEPDGCVRCEREGIGCHYSVQKQMGRPRKRPNEATNDNPPAQRSAIETGAHALAMIEGNSINVSPVFASMDSEAASFSTTDPVFDTDLVLDWDAMRFLDTMGQDNVPFKHVFSNIAPPTNGVGLGHALQDVHNASYTLGYPSLSESNKSSFPDASLAEPPPIDPALVASASSSTTRTIRAETGASSPTPLSAPRSPPSSCSCLASIYQAMTSVTRLPQQVSNAIQTTRKAMKLAYNTLQCQTCSPPLHECTDCPLTTFQVMMALGTLLPSIAAAYHKILIMVDAETTRAICTHTDLSFSFSEFGGACDHTTTTNDKTEFSNTRAIGTGNQVLSPAEWRNSVRALLKVDVYGGSLQHSSLGQQQQTRIDRLPPFTFNPASSQPPQLSLHSLAQLMDDRSLHRHALIDTMVEAGLAPPMGLCGTPIPHSHSADGRQPKCRKIIAMAREAVERLVIA
ncbi:hypothetical protein BD289DRAFT_153283 [Coniella lustricola]|uniref:Zn(2)-C6 fungal-type domain-containing protein n=1 Tax=Coniella lustricola TaxID=2025994 RepID=A0A2T3AM82_9PEZI|nr:hypothetical protein BD289DRAFT_153283 [Coniella lustricola]